MFPKIIETDPYLVSKGGKAEKTVVLLEEVHSMEKIASEALHFAKTIRPTPGKTKILVLAMGASEFYGPNRNGDGFRESELIKHHGTFKTNAHVFRSHVNKDPAKSLGRVIESFYNHDMHRVELILELDNDLAASEVSKIRQGKDVAVSMGCRIKYDVCSICGNKAPTRAEYCKHLKYEMGDIYPDGRIVFADNPKPKFFDISIVVRPADKTGYMLKKIARDTRSNVVGPKSADLAIKVSALTVLSSYLRKAADIDKTISGVAIGVDSKEIPTSDISDKEKFLSEKWISTLTPRVIAAYSEISPSKIKSLSSSDFSKVLNLLSREGVFLMTEEFLDLLFNKLLGRPSPEGLASKLLSLQQDIFSVLSKHPEIPASVIQDASLPTELESSNSSAKEARSKLAFYPGEIGFSRPINLDADTCKVAGFGVILHSAYTALALESTGNSTVKIAGVSSALDRPGLRGNGSTSRLKYLESRSIDILKNKNKLLKLSSDTSLNNIDLFTSSPKDYFLHVGYELLKS